MVQDYYSTNPKLCFVARYIGRQSEVWLWRQIKGFASFAPHVVTWDYLNASDYPLEDIPVYRVPFEPAPENSAPAKRWFYRYRNLSSFNFYGTIGKEKSHIKGLLSEMRPKVILCHFGSTALRMLPVAKELDIPLVAHFHGIDISSSLNNKWYRWSLERHAGDFDAIVVVGHHQQEWFLKREIPQSRLHVIPCGVPTDEFLPPSVRDSGIVRFITVSRINKQKGLDYTINAFRKALQETPNIHLNIVGDGEELNNLRDTVMQMGFSDKVTFSGSCPSPDVNKYLADSDVFLQHSIVYHGWCEGFGVSLAEAAAMELPIVTTRSGGIMDQVVEGRTGYLVDQKDVEGMANAMIKLAKDANLRSAMGRAGRARMIEHFDTKKQIAKLESVLLSCCHE